MNVVTLHLFQPLASDGINKPFGGAVPEKLRRLGWLELKLDLDRVPLVGSNERPVITKCEPLFVVFSHDRFQFFTRKWSFVFGQCGQEIFDRDPSRIIQLDANRFRLVTQDEAEEFAGPFLLFLFHGVVFFFPSAFHLI